MNCVQETPVKRRKLDNGTAQSQGYDSQNDSGDDIFDDYETVATIPFPAKPTQQQTATDVLTSPPAFVTQPTQIIHKDTLDVEYNGVHQTQVQVPVSSPTRAPIQAPVSVSPTPTNRTQGGRLAVSIAPPGTAFRLPVGVANAPATASSKTSPVVDLSDDDLPIYNVSSDEDSQTSNRADIKPSIFISTVQRSFDSDNAKKGPNRFKEITANSFYDPLAKLDKPHPKASSLSGSVFDSRNRDERQTTSQLPAPKRSADTMANAYGGASRRLPQEPRQKAPAKALPTRNIGIEDIQDYNLRIKIVRMRNVLPQYGVYACKRALEEKRFNYDDAMDLLTSNEGGPNRFDLTIPEGEDLLATQLSVPKNAPAKQQVTVKQNIQEKWTATQPVAKDIHSSPSSAVVLPPVTATLKPRRRLVQGRKQPSSTDPVSSPPPKPRSPTAVSSPPESLSSEPDEVDSGVGSEPDSELDDQVLKFFNICSALDLVDIASVEVEVAGVLLSQKPFHSLEEIRQISGEIPSKTAKKKAVKKCIGDKIVDKCLDMWTAYNAVDQLVKQCEAISSPLKSDMEGWGINVFGASKTGELELTSFSGDASPRDSGIGTPTSVSLSDTDDVEVHKGAKRQGLFPQPSNMPKHVKLKNYQIVGMNWLSTLYERRLSCILADDMGLGKTCQVIAFLAHLLEKDVKGPHLVVVPGSTLENWLREFSIFCPQLNVMPYYAHQSERPGIQTQILASRDAVNVVITTYTLAKQKDDNKFLRRLSPVVCVYDEGHMLKNSKAAGYDAYMRIPSRFRLLLTGTPLQNNLMELTSLLGFILPSVFNEHRHDLVAIFNHKAKTKDDSHTALLSTQRIMRAKSMMTPFVLRRKKHQVLKDIPAKHRKVEYCDLSASQIDLYDKENAKALRVITARAAGEKTGKETSNVMMALRKASIHPLLFRRLYDDRCLAKMSKAIVKEEQYRESNPNVVYEDMEVMTDMELHRLAENNPRTLGSFLLQSSVWMDSGKVSRLASLLQNYKEAGDRVLVFSQFTMVMDIVERVLETLGMRFFRLDGNTNINDRQTMIDQFQEEQDITVFLLSTKAGGAGINLAAANRVIIFDSSFNPQDDIQAG